MQLRFLSRDLKFSMRMALHQEYSSSHLHENKYRILPYYDHLEIDSGKALFAIFFGWETTNFCLQFCQLLSFDLY